MPHLAMNAQRAFIGNGKYGVDDVSVIPGVPDGVNATDEQGYRVDVRIDLWNEYLLCMLCDAITFHGAEKGDSAV